MPGGHTLAEHQIVKPEKLVATAVGMLEQELVIPNLFQKQGVDQFKGAENDTVSVPVEGVLPFHDYEWRNDRSKPIVFDEYKERKIPVAFGGNVYSAVKVTDEQMDFDLNGWGKLLRPQVKAVARGLGRRAVRTLTSAQYNVTIGKAASNLRGAFIEAQRVLDAFHAPAESRYMLVGSDYHAALLGDDKLNLAQNVGDSEAQSALRTATIGSRYGFTVIKAREIPGDAAFAFSSSGFIFLSAAPSVPQSVPYGATTSFEDIALRWVRDYDPTYMHDRSVVNTYAGFRSVTDVLVGWDEAKQSEVVSTKEHFVRGIKLSLDGASVYPPAAGELATLTGVSDAAPWPQAAKK
jgi:hypothetical protein